MTDKELFYRHLGLPSLTPMGLEIVHAEGIWLTTSDGKRYMDLVSGIAVSNTGHRHPKVLQAIRGQLDRYLHLNVYGEYIQSPQVQLAKKLTGLLPPSLDAVYFVNSGSEAVEGAVKLAKRHTGRTEVAAFHNAYHGSTQGALSILGNEGLKQAFRPLIPDVRFLMFNKMEDLAQITNRTSCVVAETIQAEAGMILPDAGFLKALRARCNETGTLLVIDDVQMGLGRTGKMFSFDHYGITPDILVLAKALGAGMPLGAFISSREIMNSLAFNPELGHITTFGGHPVSCAAALAGLDVLIEERLVEQGEEKGKLIEDLLTGQEVLWSGGREVGRSGGQVCIGSIRRKGLALGLDLADPEMRESFSKAAIEHGVMIDWYLFQPATFRIAPPLTITNEEIEEACRRITAALSPHPRTLS